jgi:wobble nucleotide-excising tRNase
MLTRLQLIRNVGQFDGVAPSAIGSLAKLTLLYAENARGKTTLSSILRSLGTGDPVHIVERSRLAAASPPHVVLGCGDGAAAIFQNGTWSRTVPAIVVFDDFFVDANVCSGLSVDPEHRQNLHTLILGARGVELNSELQQHVRSIEEHNAIVGKKRDAIPAAVRGALDVDEFCALQAVPNIEAKLLEAERSLSASLAQKSIGDTPAFDVLSLARVNVSELESVLQRGLTTLSSLAEKSIRDHFGRIGPGGEAWISDGMMRLGGEDSGEICPFCAQDLCGSKIIEHYRAYFNEAYFGLKREIAGAIATFSDVHGDDLPAAFERAVRAASDRQLFWAQFADAPRIDIDTAEIADSWAALRKFVLATLNAKQATPLEAIALSDEARAAVTKFNAHCDSVALLSGHMQSANERIRAVKEQAAALVTATLEAGLTRLKAVKARFTPEIVALCDDYIAVKQAKAATERLRDETKRALRTHRQTVFSTYHTAINNYLRRFNASFALGPVDSSDTRGGPTCTYALIVNEVSVPLNPSSRGPAAPSFKSTLSAGDRNTLALAFFFASLDDLPALHDTIVVIDDPMTSLDDGRSVVTAQLIRELVRRAAQVIVLSHNKPFLCRVWEKSDREHRVALQIGREQGGSTILAWNVEQDRTTEHDFNHALLREYLRQPSPNNREVVRAIRPVLEAFLRVACPEHFPPGDMLGPFLGRCDQRFDGPQQILSRHEVAELREILEYANKFHHESNPAYESEQINDTELVGFIQRALDFIRP